jgi:protein involved in polysaccharide export with SLBB domain
MREKGLKVVMSLFFVLISYTFAIGSDYNYKVGPGDIIEISVWRDEALVRKLVVPPDGVISFPLIGDINIQGMTVEDIRNTVTEKLDAYIQDAVVTVMLLEINSMKAYVIGKVNKPGLISYPYGYHCHADTFHGRRVKPFCLRKKRSHIENSKQYHPKNTI